MTGRLCLLAAMLGLMFQSVGAQSVHVTNIKRNDNGRWGADVVAFDRSTNALRSPTTAKVLVRGREAGGVVLDCPPPQPPADISSVLTIDISGSMAKGGPNIVLARVAANAWIDAIASGSECAITAFDNASFVAADFTTDKDRLRRAIDALQPRGGTNFTAGFMHKNGGAMQLAVQGEKKRVVVFLTDGQGGGVAADVIALAKQHDVTVYCVTLGMPMPAVLREIAENTGGLWFENVTTPDEAVMAYRRIFASATQNGTCTLKWDGTATCTAREELTFVMDGDTTRAMVDTPDSLLVGIKYRPETVEVGVIPPGTIGHRTVALVAKGGPMTIRSMNLNGPRSMSFKAPSLPLTLAPGDSITIDVQVVGGDSAFAMGRVDVVTEPCATPPLYVTSGSGLMPPILPTLRVVSPNGGERFPVSSIVPLRYEGVPPHVPVQLEVSTNLGATWTVIASAATGLSYNWRATAEPSDSCLLRASQLMQGSTVRSAAVMTFKGQKLSQAEFSPDQNLVVTSGWEQKTGNNEMYGQVRIWNSVTGAPIRVLDGGYHFAFLPDSKSMITWGEKLVRRYDVASGALMWSKELTPTNAPHAIEVSRDGSNLLVVGGWGDSTMTIDARDGKVRHVFPRLAKDVKHATMNADASLVAVVDGDSAVRVYQAADGVLKYTISEPGIKNYYRAAFQPAGPMLAVAGSNGKVSLWDMTTGRKARDVTTRKYINDNTYIAFSPDGIRIALETDADQTKVFEVTSGRELVTIQRSSSNASAFGAAFSPSGQHLAILSFYRLSVFDAYTGVQVYQTRRAEGSPSFTIDGKRFVTVGTEALAEVHTIGVGTLQEDVSDARWSLVAASGTLKNVRFSTRLVGQSVDSTVVDGITNTGKAPLIVNSVIIEGAQATDFALRTTGSFTIEPGKTAFIEYSFVPTAQGERAALITAHTSVGKMNARITGRALNTLVQVDDGVWDIGTTLVKSTRVKASSDVLRNTTAYPLTLTSFSIENNTDSLFLLKPLTAPSTIPPGGEIPLHVAFTPNRYGQHAMNLLMKFAELDDPVVLTIIGHGDTLIGPDYTDPTTFRTIALPSSIVPPAGTVTTGVYDLVGIQAGYSITDNVMVLAGGVPPLRSSWIGASDEEATQALAYSVGLKAGFRIDDQWTVAGGYQWGQSTYDRLATTGTESRITFNALYATVGFGDDDSRASLYIGYAFKRHVTMFPGTFDADATIIAGGYDFRIARRWKLCSEVVFMRTMTFVPVTLTARYFGETFALEAGVAVLAIPAGGSASTSPPLVPMVSWVKRW